MTKIQPSDDAIAIAAAHLARAVADIRKANLAESDYAQQQRHILSFYKWAAVQLTIERDS